MFFSSYQKVLCLTYIQETEGAEFEMRRREAEETANAKTAKNRAKRLKKKERSKAKSGSAEPSASMSRADGEPQSTDSPLKKRRLVNGTELVFKRPAADESGDEDEDSADEVSHQNSFFQSYESAPTPQAPVVSVDTAKITIIEEL